MKTKKILKGLNELLEREERYYPIIDKKGYKKRLKALKKGIEFIKDNTKDECTGKGYFHTDIIYITKEPLTDEYGI